MSFNGGGTILTKDGMVQLPAYIEVLSKNKVRVKLNTGPKGKQIVTVTPEDVRKMQDELGYSTHTKSAVVYFGVTWDWRPAKDFLDEMFWLFKLLEENHYAKED